MFLRPRSRSHHMVLAMMAGRTSACPMTCSVPVARQRSTVSGLTWPPKDSMALSRGSKRTPPIVAIPLSKAPSVKMSIPASHHDRGSHVGAQLRLGIGPTIPELNACHHPALNNSRAWKHGLKGHDMLGRRTGRRRARRTMLVDASVAQLSKPRGSHCSGCS